MKKQATGGKRLQRMLPKIDRGGLWIDTYNQSVSDIAGTIKARVNSNLYFVSEDSSNEEDGQSDDRGERSSSGI